MQTTNFILSGLGGQGILFMTKMLAQTALRKGINVLGAETHGMAQRGGSVVSHLKLGDARSSLINAGTAHFLLGLEENEAYRNLPFLAYGSKLFVNATPETFPRPEVTPFLNKMNVTYRAVSASQLALEMGVPLASNLALIGFMAAFDDGPFQAQELRETIQMISPDRFMTANLKVFEAGLEHGKQMRFR